MMDIIKPTFLGVLQQEKQRIDYEKRDGNIS